MALPIICCLSVFHFKLWHINSNPVIELCCCLTKAEPCSLKQLIKRKKCVLVLIKPCVSVKVTVLRGGYKLVGSLQQLGCVTFLRAGGRQK